MTLTDIYTPEWFAENHVPAMLSAVVRLAQPGTFIVSLDSYAAEIVVAPIVMEQLAPRSVLDLGCGQGEWLEALIDLDSFGVDIAAPGFMPHDLTTPLDLGRTFDLIVSLETAEHLPECAVATYIDSISRHKPRAVLFSAATPGQEGLHHVNCQPHEYWHEMFELHGFEVTDPIRPLIRYDARVSEWYRKNLYVYR